MANYSQTVSNTLRFFGPGETELWNSLVWGTDNWGWDEETDFLIEQWLANSVTIDSDADFQVLKGIANSIALSAAFGKSLTLGPWSESVTVSSRINFVSLSQGSWVYILNGASDPDNRHFPTWTAATADTETWTEATAASTTWS